MKRLLALAVLIPLCGCSPSSASTEAQGQTFAELKTSFGAVVIDSSSRCEERREAALEYALALDANKWSVQVEGEISQLRGLLDYELKLDCSVGRVESLVDSFDDWKIKEDFERNRLERIRTAEQELTESFYDLELARLGMSD